MNDYHANALCQSLILEGVPPKVESKIESRITHFVKHNGPEFAIAVLKDLKDHTISNLDVATPHEFHDGGISLAWDKTHDRPKGPLGLIYKMFPNPVSRVRVIGSMIQAIELETLSKKQIERFVSGVLSKGRTPEDVTIPLEYDVLLELSKNIRNEFRQLDDYSAKELTASVLPEGTMTNNISRYKSILARRSIASSGKPQDYSYALAKLDAAAINQFYTSPLESRTYFNHMMSSTGQLQRKIPAKIHMTPFKSRPYEQLKYKGNQIFIEDYRPYIGTFGMLQQGGGKLRSVANINRFINYTLTPFAKAMEKTFYSAKEIAVKDQEEGLEWAQRKLREGIMLSSMDLSQATDLLDFRVLIRTLKHSGLKALSETAKYFEYLAESPLYVPDLDGSISFSTGQPLGMKGSFQVLTVMNYMAGKIAANRSGLPSDSFRVVGDDFVCDTRMADEYNSIIESWSGKTNIEKSLTSDKYAEFLSHIVTRDHIYLVKPKYRPGYDSIYANADKSTVERMIHYYRLRAQDKENLSILAATADPRFSNTHSVRGAYRLPEDDRMILSIAKSIIASFGQGGVSNSETVSRQSLDLAHQAHQVFDSTRELDRRIYVKSGDSQVITDIARGPVHLDKGEFSTVIDRYDHKTSTRVAKKLLKKRVSRNASAKDARVVKKLHDDLVDGKTSSINVGPGLSVDSTAILNMAIDVSEQVKSRFLKELDEARDNGATEFRYNTNFDHDSGRFVWLANPETDEEYPVVNPIYFADEISKLRNRSRKSIISSRIQSEIEKTISAHKESDYYGPSL